MRRVRRTEPDPDMRDAAASQTPRSIPPMGRRSLGLVTLASLVIGLLIWQGVAQGYSRFVLAPPSAVLVRLWQLTASLELPRALGGALRHMGLGYAIACAIAIPTGLLMGRVRFIHDLLDPVVNLIYAVPSVAWMPFIMI